MSFLAATQEWRIHTSAAVYIDTDSESPMCLLERLLQIAGANEKADPQASLNIFV